MFKNVFLRFFSWSLSHDFDHRPHFVKTLHTIHTTTHKKQTTSDLLINNLRLSHRIAHTWLIWSDSLWSSCCAQSQTLLTSLLFSWSLGLRSGSSGVHEYIIKAQHTRVCCTKHWWKSINTLIHFQRLDCVLKIRTEHEYWCYTKHSKAVLYSPSVSVSLQQT